MTHRVEVQSLYPVSHALYQCGLYAVVQIGMAYVDVIAERPRASRAAGTRPGG
jgi:hypothetical protein